VGIGEIRDNTLADLVSSVAGVFPSSYGTPEEIAQPFTLGNASAYTPLSLNRILLSYAYMTIGLIQTIIDQPVEDAFRGGMKLEIPELDQNEVHELYNYMEGLNDFKAIKDVARWARLYGGGGLIAVTDQNPLTELQELEEGDELTFRAADRWELVLANLQWATPDGNPPMSTDRPYPVTDVPYNYYGRRLHKSRVIKMNGREAPSFIRLRLQGWGMSEIERCIRSINTFLKLQSVVFELVDEAKIDVFNIEGFNMTLGTPQGTDMVTRRIQLASMLKNYKRALVMDKEDGYTQKQVSFGGLAEIFEQARIDLCSDLKMPATKLFGQSAQGFSTGAEDIENYNTVVEGDVRHPIKPLIREAVSLRCQQLFGLTPEHVGIKFHPLRVLDGTEEEQVHASRTTRTLGLFDRGLLTGEETMEYLKHEGTFPMKTEIGEGKREVEANQQEEDYGKHDKAK
jgi:phage-related protein (TIGR01555 family)